MEFLKILEGIRNPFLDGFFSLITRFGEETIFIIAGILFLWCINKKYGYYLFFVGFSGLITNQFLKFVFRVPRPWVRNPELTIVKSAEEMAYGYSFPSGHTQVSVGLYGGIARLFSNKAVRILSIALAVLISFSRMYLGVHTPIDVITSVGIASVLIFGFYPLINNSFENGRKMNILFLVCTIFSGLYLCFISLYKFPSDVNIDEVSKGIEDGYKITGSIMALWISYNIDVRYLNYSTSAKIWIQIIKLLLGLGLVLVIKELLKEPLLVLFNGGHIAGAVRYFVIVFFAGTIWPAIFKLYNKKMQSDF